MSSTKTKKSLNELISKAAEEYTYIRVARFEAKEGGKTTLGRKTNASIGGSYNYWNKQKDFYYWPMYRLAGTNYEELIRYAIINKLHNLKGERMRSGGEYELGPFIGKDEDNHPATFMVSLKVTSSSNGEYEGLKSEFVDEGAVPVYRYEYTKGDKDTPGSLSIRVSSKSPKSPEDFIKHEKDQHSGINKEKDEKADKEADLDLLADNIYKYKIPAKSGKSSKTSGSKKVATSYKDFLEPALSERIKAQTETEKGKKHSASEYWLSIDNLSEKLTGSRLILASKLTDKYIKYGDTRIVFKVESAKSKHAGPIWFFRAKHGWDGEKGEDSQVNVDAAAAGKAELKEVLRAGVKIHVNGKNANASSDEEKPKKDKKKKAKKQEDSEEEEEEEEESS